MRNSYTLLWIALGLGSSLQLVASLSISELLCFVLAPLWAVTGLHEMKRHGAFGFFGLSLLVVAGSLTACLVNKTPGYYFLRGMAVACLLPCAIVVSHRLLSRDPAGFKWYLVGCAISNVLSTFIFQKTVEVSMMAQGIQDAETAKLIISGPLYWIGRVEQFVMLPIRGWYLTTPSVYSIVVPVAFALFAVLTSASGRSTAVISFFGVALIFICGKSIKKMELISKHVLLLACAAIAFAFVLKSVYQYSAVTGVLGENARAKYEAQTKGRTDMWSLLIGGRCASFAGYPACLDHPIIGMGPYAVDDKGYYEDFLRRFGNGEDYENYVRNLAWEAQMGQSTVHLVAGHSSVVIFWLQFGIFGLIFWLYIFYVLFRYVREDWTAVPNWFGWIAYGLPGFLWNAFFSPFSARIGVPMIVVACLMVRAVRQGRFALPIEMLKEIRRHAKD